MKIKIPQFLKSEKSLNVNNDSGFFGVRDYFSQKLTLDDYNQGWNYTAENTVAQAMASTEFFYKNKDGEIQTNKMFNDLMKKPNEYQYWDDFIYLCGMYVLGVHGFAPIVINKEINPTEMIVLPPESFINFDGKKYTVNYNLNNTSVTKTIPAKLVKFVRQPSLDAIDEAKGISAFLADNINLEKRKNELMTSSLLNKGRLGTYLTTDKSLSDERIKRMTKQFNSQQRGTKKSYLARVFDGGIKVHESNVNHKDLEAVEIGKQVKDQVLSNYHVSDISLGRENASSNATALVANKILYTQAVFPLLNKISTVLNHGIIVLFSDYQEGDYICYNNQLEIDPEVKAKVGKMNAEKVNILSKAGYKLKDEELEELGFEKVEVEEIKEPVIEEAKEDDEEEKKKHLETILKKETDKLNKSINIIRKNINKKEVEKVEKKDIDDELTYHQKKLDFAKPLELQASKKLKTFFNKARKMDKSLSEDEQQTLIDEYILLLLPIYEKAMRNQGKLLIESRGLEEMLSDEFVKDESTKQAEKAGESVVNTINNDTKGKNAEEKQDYYNDREQKIDDISVNEVHTAIGIATVQMFKINNITEKKWLTVGDERVCQFCRPMDGVTIKTSDDYWDKNETMIGLDGGELKFNYGKVIAPPLHTRCRCSVVNVNSNERPSGKSFESLKTQNEMRKVDKNIKLNFEKIAEENKKSKEESEKEIVKVINSL